MPALPLGSATGAPALRSARETIMFRPVLLAALAFAFTAALLLPASGAQVDAVIATIPVPGQPFASVSTHDGHVLFVSVSGTPAGVVVFRVVPKGLERIGFITLRTRSALGLALLADDSVLLVADGEGVALIDAAAAMKGAPTQPVYVEDDPHAGTIEVLATPDGRTAFAADENLARVSVLRVQRQPSGAPGAVRTGRIGVDRAPVGLALSPDGTTLYVASEIASGDGATPGARGDLSRSCGPRRVPNGTLTAIDVARGTVVARLAAGCSPVRAVVTADGTTVWVSVRGDDRVAAFDAAKIRTDPAHAFVTEAAVGSAPVGIALLAHDTLLAVANSNRFDPGAPTSNATILKLGTPPAQRSSVATGAFPREFSISPDGSVLYLTNFRSRTIQLIDVTRL
jgi:DNA-binding beta-propeller fold protein YncE